MKGQATNIVAVVVVIGIVACAAWFKSQRSEGPVGDDGSSSSQTSDAQTAKPAGEGAERETASSAVSKLPRLVDLGATSCKACKELAPILDSLREEYKGRLDVEFIDVWKNRNAGTPYNIRMIPTQVLFDKDGKEVWRHEGFISKEDLKKLFVEKVGVK